MQTTVTELIHFYENDEMDEAMARLLFEKYESHIYNILKKCGCPTSDLDDLFQEVCLAIWARKGKFKHQRKGSLRNFIYTICRSTVCNHYRKISRKKESPSNDYELMLNTLLGTEDTIQSDSSLDQICVNTVEQYLKNVGDNTYQNIIQTLFEEQDQLTEINKNKSYRDKYNFINKVVDKVKVEAQQTIGPDISRNLPLATQNKKKYENSSKSIEITHNNIEIIQNQSKTFKIIQNP